MSVTIKAFKNGTRIFLEIFEGYSIDPVIDYLKENKIDYRLDKSAEEAKELTANQDIFLMCIDDSPIVPYESITDSFTEYLLEFDQETYDDIRTILNNQRFMN